MQLALDIMTDAWRVAAARTDVFDRAGSFGEGLAGVSEHRRTKVLSYRFEKDRRLSLLAGLLLDELLGGYGLRERDMRYAEGEHGKPAFADRGDLHFSLAHSGRLSVAALSGHPVGVDVERLSDFPFDLADPREWTEMEAVGKLVGCGVGAFVDTRAFTVPPDVSLERWQLEDYEICLAWRRGAQANISSMTLQ